MPIALTVVQSFFCRRACLPHRACHDLLLQKWGFYMVVCQRATEKGRDFMQSSPWETEDTDRKKKLLTIMHSHTSFSHITDTDERVLTTYPSSEHDHLFDGSQEGSMSRKHRSARNSSQMPISGMISLAGFSPFERPGKLEFETFCTMNLLLASQSYFSSLLFGDRRG